MLTQSSQGTDYVHTFHVGCWQCMNLLFVGLQRDLSNFNRLIICVKVIG